MNLFPGDDHHKWLPVCVWRNNRLPLQHGPAQAGPDHQGVDPPQTQQCALKSAWREVPINYYLFWFWTTMMIIIKCTDMYINTFYRYRHELAHDGQRIYILGGGTSWTSYPLDKVIQMRTQTNSRERLCAFLVNTLPSILCLFQIHAYNLETNYWEEMVTKPHEKIGWWAMTTVFLSLTIWFHHTELTSSRFITGYPAARRCHSCVQVKNGRSFGILEQIDEAPLVWSGVFWTWLSVFPPKEVFICGGYNGEVILSDLWKVNLQTFQWTKLPAVMPEPAYFHCAAVTPVSHLSHTSSTLW